MQIRNIDHFELCVSDIDQALDFYRRVGFEVKDIKREGSDRRRTFLRIADREEINIVTPSSASGPGRGVVAGAGHFAVAVGQTMDQVTEQLARNGITPRGPVGPGEGAQGKGNRIFVTDPDGNSVELIAYGD